MEGKSAIVNISVRTVIVLLVECLYFPGARLHGLGEGA
jgi:hypothetical protein